MVIHLLLSVAGITPRKKVDRGIPGKLREEGKKDEVYEQARKQEAGTEDPSPKDQKVKKVSCENDLLYRRNLLWVPKGLVQRIMESEYDRKNERTNHRLCQKLPGMPAE